ncbi:MAG: peptidylprolyl isomerase [Anaerolineae bacterium]|nr:peptidylprolyl isomerase [Anaerolineae bacterium]
MLRLDRPNSAGSQFFITKEALPPDFDGRYTVFGQVVTGMDVVQALALRDPFTDPPPPPGDRILSITIEQLAPDAEAAD